MENPHFFSKTSTTVSKTQNLFARKILVLALYQLWTRRVTTSAKTTWLPSGWDPYTTNAERDKYSDEEDVFPDFLGDFFYPINMINKILMK